MLGGLMIGHSVTSSSMRLRRASAFAASARASNRSQGMRVGLVGARFQNEETEAEGGGAGGVGPTEDLFPQWLVESVLGDFIS
jgi:hypothetical protein